MKSLRTSLALLTIMYAFAINSFADSRVQVIHNSADMAAQSVDVWLDNTLLLDNFMFRTASPFVDAPSGVEFTISIAGPGSESPDEAIWSQNYTLEDGKTYVLVANGIVSETGYDPATPFDIYVYGMGRETASMTGNTDVLVFHGSTDAPTVDVVEIGAGAGTIVDDLMYGDYQGYLELPTANYVLDIRDETGMSSVIAYSAPLADLGLTDAALVTVASGFLNPDNNSGGEAFGLWVALPTGGELIALPVYEPAATARVQVIHNSADMAAEMVDVYLNDGLLIDDFTFRTASPFIDAPAGEEFTIYVAGPDSESNMDAIWSQSYTLAEGETYVLVANGIVSETGYDPNQPFDIYVYGMGREMASDPMNTDMLVFHGSTDAPTVDIVEIGAGAGTIADNLMYSDFQGYVELPASTYVLDIRDETGENSIIAYQVPSEFLELEGKAVVALASGFLNPENNSGGPAFGMFLALPTGGPLEELPPFIPGIARVQVIHNSADAAASVVDVWLNETLLLDDFAFRTASPFVDAPTGVNLTIAIKGPDSENPDDPIWSMDYKLEDGKTYVLVANGIVSPSGYDPATPFDIYVYDMGRENAIEGITDVLVFHGSTDAPTVDVVETGVGAGTIVDDLMYGDFQGYLELPTADYQLSIKDETGASTLAVYLAPLETLGLNGAALVTVASGFLNPDNNSDGPVFGLWVALPTGGELVELPNVTSVEETLVDDGSFNIYPNPARTSVNIDYLLTSDADVQVFMFDLTGSMIKAFDLGTLREQAHKITLNISDLRNGLYFVKIQAGNSVITRRIQVVN